MKLAQFKTKNSGKQRLGILIGDVVGDVAELARASRTAGRNPPDWLLDIRGTSEVIQRGSEGCQQIDDLLNSNQPAQGGASAAMYALDSIDFLPACYPSKILAIGRNYAEHAAEGGSDLPVAP